MYIKKSVSNKLQCPRLHTIR